MDETSRRHIYEQGERRPRRVVERAEQLSYPSTGSVVAMVLATLLLAMLAVWVLAQGWS